jgi:hypothetical protein
VLGVTIKTDSPFFAKPLPIFFHFVLASFLLVCGAYHIRCDRQRWGGDLK